jgi:hypothetical protein
MFREMIANSIARRLVLLALAIALTVGVAPVAMARTAMIGCDMATGSADLQTSMPQDQRGMPMQKQQTPYKDMDGCCAAICAGAIGVPQAGHLPALTSKSAVPGWPAQVELAGIRSQPDLPPPIVIL